MGLDEGVTLETTASLSLQGGNLTRLFPNFSVSCSRHLVFTLFVPMWQGKIPTRSELYVLEGIENFSLRDRSFLCHYAMHWMSSLF